MQSSAAFLLPFLVLGLVLGSDLGVQVLIEYGRAEHVMCQSLGLRNCHIADIDFDVLHDDSVIDVRIGGRVYARSFKNDQKDGFQVFESDEGDKGRGLLAYYVDTAGVERVHAALDGGRVIVTSDVGMGYHIMGNPKTSTGLSRRQLQQPKCKTGDRLSFAACFAAKNSGKCQLSFFRDVQCEATCGNNCCGDSNFNNCPSLAAVLPDNVGCALFGGNNLCRKSCKICSVAKS